MRGGYTRLMPKVIYPGSFDPPTYGHLNIIERAARIFESVEVVISVNPRKKSTFTPEERKALLDELVTGMDNVSIVVWDGLVVDYAKATGAQVIIRGVRALGDFAHEFELAMLNKGLDPEVETIFMPTDPQYFVLRSSAIKEIVSFGGDVSSLVPSSVERALRDKLGEGRR